MPRNRSGRPRTLGYASYTAFQQATRSQPIFGTAPYPVAKSDDATDLDCPPSEDESLGTNFGKPKKDLLEEVQEVIARHPYDRDEWIADELTRGKDGKIKVIKTEKPREEYL